jgi:outer membrane protein TolC
LTYAQKESGRKSRIDVLAEEINILDNKIDILSSINQIIQNRINLIKALGGRIS